MNYLNKIILTSLIITGNSVYAQDNNLEKNKKDTLEVVIGVYDKSNNNSIIFFDNVNQINEVKKDSVYILKWPTSASDNLIFIENGTKIKILEKPYLDERNRYQAKSKIIETK